MNRSAKIAIAAAAMAACAIPAGASAQTYYGQQPYSGGYGQPAYSQGHAAPAYGQSYYDQCVRDQRQRQVTGGLLGAAIGAGVGRAAASRRVRTEGGLLGAALGAMAGASVGRSTAACESQNASYGYDYDYGQGRYEQDYGYGRDPYARDPYDRGGYDRDYGYGQSDRGYGRPDPYAQDGCRLSESRVRLPDGREDVRHVRVCPDSSGRYRIVD